MQEPKERNGDWIFVLWIVICLVTLFLMPEFPR
jgi:hypothetical protein